MADAVEEEIRAQQQGGAVAKDLFAGAVGGIAQVMIGQPFDIVKVRLQTTTAYTGALDAASQILKHEGAAAFYKGTLTPLVGIGACVSVQFGAFNFARRYFESSNGAGTPLSYTQYYLAGAFAGIANTPLSTPIEHVRIRMQTQPHGAARLYNGPADCIRKLSSATHGGSIAHGLYRGSAVTALREAQAYGFWFLSFEYMMAADMARNSVARKEIPTWKVAAYGGLAGEMLWIASYPFDVVKSKMQTDAVAAEGRKYRNMRDCFAQVYRAQGLGGFWRGVGPTLVRALPVSAGTFATCETVLRLIS